MLLSEATKTFSLKSSAFCCSLETPEKQSRWSMRKVFSWERHTGMEIRFYIMQKEVRSFLIRVPAGQEFWFGHIPEPTLYRSYTNTKNDQHHPLIISFFILLQLQIPIVFGLFSICSSWVIKCLLPYNNSLHLCADGGIPRKYWEIFFPPVLLFLCEFSSLSPFHYAAHNSFSKPTNKPQSPGKTP